MDEMNLVLKNYNFWSLLKHVVPPDVARTLKKNYKALHYIGLDLKLNSIPIEKLQKLKKLEILIFR